MNARKTARAPMRDPRLPAPGSTIERVYKGRAIRVAVLEKGFRLGKREFSSLSALARHVTGAASINGPLFFRLSTPAAAKRTSNTATKRTTKES
jgi:hypothetical protein